MAPPQATTLPRMDSRKCFELLFHPRRSIYSYCITVYPLVSVPPVVVSSAIHVDLFCVLPHLVRGRRSSMS